MTGVAMATTKRRGYAHNTAVPVERTQQEIRRVVMAHGAHGFVLAEGFDSDRGLPSGMVQFNIGGRIVRMVRRYPPKGFGTERQRDQEWRRSWRALLLIVKAKLELVAAGDSTVDREFLADVMLPDGSTVADHALGALRDAYASGEMPRLLPGGTP